MTITTLLMKPVMKWAAQRALTGRNRDRQRPEAGRFTRAEVNSILQEGWRSFALRTRSVPREPTVGNRMNMMLACVTLSMFQALLAAGVDRAYSIELLGDAAWKVYQMWGVIPRVLARLRSRNAVERMRLQVNTFLKFPFNPPGYAFTRLPAEDGISFDMHRCPVAAYFRTQDAADLCVGTWCNQDYALAEAWGGRLERTGTLAAGHPACTFRFKVAR